MWQEVLRPSITVTTEEEKPVLTGSWSYGAKEHTKCHTILPSYYAGGQKSVASQAPDLRECEISITPFDCPRDMLVMVIAEALMSDETAQRASRVRLVGARMVVRRCSSLRAVGRHVNPNR
jgi:hypothetical protein